MAQLCIRLPVLQSFHPNWFLFPQDVSLLSLLLINPPFLPHALRVPSLVAFFIALVSLILFTVLLVLKLVVYPQAAARGWKGARGSKGICGFASWVISLESLSAYLSWRGYHGGATVLFWVTSGLSIAVALTVAYVFLLAGEDAARSDSRDGAKAEQFLPPFLLLPCIGVLTAAATGATVLNTAGERSGVRDMCEILVGFGLPWAFAYAFYFLIRVFGRRYRPVRRENALSVMLLVGPFGQAGFALGNIGGKTWGVVANKMLFGWATFWIALATAETLRATLGRGWRSLRTFEYGTDQWGIIFPMGIYTNCCTQLANGLESRAFQIYAMIWFLVTFITFFATLIAATIWMFKFAFGSRADQKDNFVDISDS